MTRTIATLAAGAMLLAACGDGDAPQQDDPTQGEPTQGEEAPEGQSPGDEDTQAQEPPTPEDPNEDVEDGIYRGNGVVLPVPDGWSLDPAAFQQGVVAAVDEEGSQQITAQAVDAEAAAAAGQELDLDTLLDGLRDQVEQEPEVDEEVELAGAERAHRLTYTGLPGQAEGAPESTATIVLAQDGDGLFGEFAFTAASDAYQPEIAELLLAEAGFDPDSEPQPPPAPPVPEGGGQQGGGQQGGG